MCPRAWRRSDAPSRMEALRCALVHMTHACMRARVHAHMQVLHEVVAAALFWHPEPRASGHLRCVDVDLGLHDRGALSGRGRGALSGSGRGALIGNGRGAMSGHGFGALGKHGHGAPGGHAWSWCAVWACMAMVR
eukprot:362218-Chlamydomonas_euryale.AAC.1